MPVKRTGNALTFQGFTISVRDCVPFIRVPEIRDSKNTNIQKNETVLSIFAYMADDSVYTVSYKSLCSVSPCLESMFCSQECGNGLFNFFTFPIISNY